VYFNISYLCPHQLSIINYQLSITKIVLAFDSFKGCMTAAEACAAAARGAREACPEAQIEEIPLSDGGEGLVACVARMLPVSLVTLQVHGPLMQPVTATYALSPDGTTAYMEMASASGLTLVPFDQRNPLHTTTYGVGEMLLDATRRGCTHIIMGIGGSATCDGGSGMIQCLTQHQYFQLDAARQPRITVACDVTNPLYGEEGAAYIFAPQKGATPQQVQQLDERLRQFERQTIALGRATRATAWIAGAGAAGGLGYGLVAYLGATLRSGIDIILDLLQFDQRILHADYVITGEGHSDAQTLMGKVPMGVLRRTPAHLLSGGISDADQLLDAGFLTVRSINQGDDRPLATLLRPDIAQANLQRSIRNIIV